MQLLGEGFNTEFHENILKQLTEKRRIFKERTLIRKGTMIHKDYNLEYDDSSDYSDEGKLIINNDLIENSVRFSIRQAMNKIKNIPLVDPIDSIYETMINNLKIIFQLMELNSSIEGELSFDKLVILSTNIIDFLIEYIDTKKSLIAIIDTNISNLFFGKGIIKNIIKKCENNNKYNNIEYKGILQLFSMKIKDKDKEKDEGKIEEDENEKFNNFNKYKLRKTMLAYIKIKYFQLLKAYIQFGNKNDFVKLLLEKKFGPMQMFEEVIYYMIEIINNLLNKDYNKYNYLLDINNINLYKDMLRNLYMYEDDFSSSIELNLIFQICIIIKILEDTYGIIMLSEYYNKENKEIKKQIKENIEENKINEEFEIQDILSEKEKTDIKNENDENKKKINFYKNNITNNITNNISNTITPLKTRLHYLSSFNTHTNDNNNINNSTNNNINNIIILKENPKYKNYKKETEINKSLYKNIFKNYKKFIKKKTIKENEEKLAKIKKRKLDKNNLDLKSKFALSVYEFLFSLVLKVEIKPDIYFNENKL